MMEVPLLAPLAFLALVVLGLIALGFVAMLLNHRQQVRRHEQENELKRDLVAKGASAEEIERIVRATAGEAKPKLPGTAETQRPTGAGSGRARLIQVMCEHGMDGGDVERVLLAVGVYTDDELPARVAAIESMVENGMEAKDVERVLRAFQRAPGIPDLPPEKGQTAFRE